MAKRNRETSGKKRKTPSERILEEGSGSIMEKNGSPENSPLSQGNKGDGLYLLVLEEVERRLLKRAREVEGLDEEIALLRVKLASALAQEPHNTELLLKGLTVLIRAVATRARYSPKAEEEHYKNMLNVLKELGSTLFPENFQHDR